ncbi:MAG TPA: HAD family phosphatase [Gaiellaceae bacterium]|nr:HAD family phosphatase [Gaiellaceae bacterium]
MRPRAVVFDFNGTISNDEPILCVIFQRLFAAHGKPLAAQDYYDRLAGLSDPEIVRTWLGRDHPAVAEVIEQRIALYRAAVADGSSISDSVRAAVRCAAERVPVGIVSGASREEIAPVLEAAGLDDVVSVVVADDDVVEGKPSPEGYARALELLDGGIRAGEVVVFEDTEAGIAAAKSAGMRCIGVLGTLAEERLAAADELVPGIDRTVVENLFA